jgi:hypothetical protein
MHEHGWIDLPHDRVVCPGDWVDEQGGVTHADGTHESFVSVLPREDRPAPRAVVLQPLERRPSKE